MVHAALLHAETGSSWAVNHRCRCAPIQARNGRESVAGSERQERDTFSAGVPPPYSHEYLKVFESAKVDVKDHGMLRHWIVTPCRSVDAKEEHAESFCCTNVIESETLLRKNSRLVPL